MNVTQKKGIITMSFTTIINVQHLSERRLDANYYSPSDILKEERIKGVSHDLLGNRLKKISSGATPKGATYLDNGISFIRTQNVRDNVILDKELVFISEADNLSLKRSQLKEEDVLLTITGVDLGRSAVVPKSLLPANINQHSVKMEVKGLDPYYLSVFLNSEYGQSQIWRRVYGATRPALNYDEIKQLLIPTPSLHIQEYIGDKIRKAELLREESRQLKMQVEKEFYEILPLELINHQNKNWEVPISYLEDRLDVNYYNQGYLTVRDFLGSLRDNDYKIVKLKEIVKDVFGGYPFPSEDFRDNGIPLLRIRDIDEDLINFEVDAYIDDKKYTGFEGYLSNFNNIVVGMDGNFLAGSFSKSMPDMFINQRIGIIETEHYHLANYLKFYINSTIGQSQLNRGSVRTTVGHISLKDIKELIICIPSKEAVEKLGSKIYLASEKLMISKLLVFEARQDVESLIEGTFDEIKINEIV